MILKMDGILDGYMFEQLNEFIYAHDMRMNLKTSRIVKDTYETSQHSTLWERQKRILLTTRIWNTTKYSESKTNIRNLKDMFPPEIKKIFSDIEEIDPSIGSQLKELYSLTRMKFPESSDDDIAKEFIEIIDKMMKEKD